MAASLIAVGAITTANPTPTGALANVLVFLSECSRLCVISPALPVLTNLTYTTMSVFLWLIAFTQSWTNIPWTVSAELPSEATREKTLAIGAFGGYVTGMLVGLLNPYMQNAEYGNLGGKVGFVCKYPCGASTRELQLIDMSHQMAPSRSQLSSSAGPSFPS